MASILDDDNNDGSGGYRIRIIGDDSDNDGRNLDDDTPGSDNRRGGHRRNRGRGRSARGRGGRGNSSSRNRGNREEKQPDDVDGPTGTRNRGNMGFRQEGERGRGTGRGRGRGRGCGTEGENYHRRDRADDRGRGSYRETPGKGKDITDDNGLRKTEAMQFHKLIYLSKHLDDPDKILLDLSNSKSGFKEFLENPVEGRHYYLLFKVLSAAMKTQQLQGVRHLLQLLENNLLAKLLELLQDMCMRTQETRCIWNNRNEFPNFIAMVTAVLKKSMTALHSSVSKCSVVLLSLQQIQIHFFSDGGSPIVTNEIQDTFAIQRAIMEEKEKLKAEQASRMLKPKRKKTNHETMLPPEDFRTLSILPTLLDLQMDEKPFLRANKTKGTYDSLDTYLDIQFRLLREDYINPLRSGITQYRDAVMSKTKVARFRDIRLYHDVQILRPVCSSSGINYVIQFDVTRFKKMNWSASKRLIHGSLLCLSNDDFDSAFYAIVTERVEKELNDGMLQVQFVELPEWIQPSDKFIMAETTAYFEAYRHILLGLQEIQSLPLERYIIECETVVKPPEYLLKLGGPKYDFSCLMNREDVEEYPVLNTCQWPRKSTLGFDESQYEALKAAITKELAIIQGPPGTGKTYVGLKIARLLKENKMIWQKSNNSHAILVVCYTNHALDQFLEGVLGFSEGGIVRIGGRCNNDILEDYMLKNLKKKKREERSRSWGILQNEKDCRRQLRESEQFITHVSSRLLRTTTEIISFKNLAEFMTESQIHSFADGRKECSDDTLCVQEWLGLTIYDKEEDTGILEEDMKIKQLWETYLIEESDRLTGNVSYMTSVWDLELHKRAMLYKSWVFEFIGTVELKLLEVQNMGNETSMRAAEDLLEKIITHAETQLVSAKLLRSYITTPSYQGQLSQLISLPGRQVSAEEIMSLWLCLDGSKNSTETIKATLESIDNKKDSATDLEEERELRDDDLEFTYGDDDDNDDDNYGRRSVMDEEDWTVQRQKKKSKREVKAMLNKSTALSEMEAKTLQDVRYLPLHTKRNLYRYWLEQYRNKLRENVKAHEKQFTDATLRLEEVRNQETMEILKTADFIGMTTTGAAKYRKLLQLVGPRIIIVEEAAEVLESHVVTTLNDDCKHLILIGDHKQLRPSTTVYELAKKYGLDISLFERLVNNGVPCVTLSEQHRMRPSISVLMRHKNLYPNLKDHPVVCKYDNVKGLDVNVQFITHEEPEGTNQESTSYHNMFEAKFLAKFCCHLLRQGYLPEQITVLSPYMGQVLTLRKEMPKSEFNGVRITAVDNFQGEENDIILLSLVRSSKPSKVEKRNPIGFLGIENRVCVALSRAKEGLFVFGNFTLLRDCSEMWDFMVRRVAKTDSSIKLVCQNHPENKTIVKGPDDFKETPEGGCLESCGFLLTCGHICERFCHIVDKDHKYTKCFKPCPKKCDFGHRCKKKCYEDCKKCDTKVEKTVPRCGHIASMPCHREPDTWKCETKCSVILGCGHECKQACHMCTTVAHRQQCKEICEQKLSCGHTVKVECFRGNDVECSILCEEKLDCGHKCIGKCGTCQGGKIHSGCNGSCQKVLPCGHKCAFPCSELCPPCSRRCEYVCPHDVRCKKKCFEPCDKCMEDCKFKCKHMSCSNLCSEPCSDVVCEKPCPRGTHKKDRKDDCNHKCIGLCGEPCPKLCAICDQSKLEDSDYTYTENDKFIELPDCGHVIEVTRMDEIMSKPFDHRGEMVKRCPKCKKVIRKSIKRYANILRNAQKNLVKKFNSLTGSAAERTNKAKLLTMEIEKLRQVGIGLDDEEIKELQKQVNPDKFGKLLVSSRKIEHLRNLLQIRQKFAVCARSSPFQTHLQYCIDGIRDTKAVQKVLMTDKQQASKQYWREIGLEIKRLENIVVLMQLRESKYSTDFGDMELKNYFVKGLAVLTDGKKFDQPRADVLEKVIHRLSNPTAPLPDSLLTHKKVAPPSTSRVPASSPPMTSDTAKALREQKTQGTHASLSRTKDENKCSDQSELYERTAIANPTLTEARVSESKSLYDGTEQVRSNRFEAYQTEKTANVTEVEPSFQTNENGARETNRYPRKSSIDALMALQVDEIREAPRDKKELVELSGRSVNALVRELNTKARVEVSGRPLKALVTEPDKREMVKLSGRPFMDLVTEPDNKESTEIRSSKPGNLLMPGKETLRSATEPVETCVYAPIPKPRRSLISKMESIPTPRHSLISKMELENKRDTSTTSLRVAHTSATESLSYLKNHEVDKVPLFVEQNDRVPENRVIRPKDPLYKEPISELSERNALSVNTGVRNTNETPAVRKAPINPTIERHMAIESPNPPTKMGEKLNEPSSMYKYLSPKAMDVKTESLFKPLRHVEIPMETDAVSKPEIRAKPVFYKRPDTNIFTDVMGKGHIIKNETPERTTLSERRSLGTYVDTNVTGLKNLPRQTSASGTRSTTLESRKDEVDKTKDESSDGSFMQKYKEYMKRLFEKDRGLQKSPES